MLNSTVKLVGLTLFFLLLLVSNSETVDSQSGSNILRGSSKYITSETDKVGNLLLFSIGLNDNIPYYKYQLSHRGNWSNWIDLGGQSNQLAIGETKNGNLVIFSLARDEKLYYKYQLSADYDWSSWKEIIGKIKNINVNSDKSNLYVYAIGADSAPHLKNVSSLTGSRNDDWAYLKGQSKNITSETDEAGNLLLFSIGLNDNTPYYKYQLSAGGNWSDWISLEEQSKYISAGHDKNGVPILFSIGLNDNIPYYKYQLSAGGNWSNWIDLGAYRTQ